MSNIIRQCSSSSRIDFALYTYVTMEPDKTMGLLELYKVVYNSRISILSEYSILILRIAVKNDKKSENIINRENYRRRKACEIAYNSAVQIDE